MTLADGEPSAPPPAARPPRRIALLLAFVGLVTVSLSLFVTEISLFQLQPASGGHHLSLRRPPSPSTPIECRDGTPSRDKCVIPLLELGSFTGPETALYADEIFQIDWSNVVTRTETRHLGELQSACLTHRESVIPWNYGRTDGDRNAVLVNHTDDHAPLLEALRQCPSFDVYIPDSLRGHGYCEDAAAYTKYAHARMLPRWVLDTAFFDAKQNRTVRYHELCPRTPLMVFNHYWDGLRNDELWPTTKPLFLMPNIEMFELEAEHYWQADVVFCKTVVCADYLERWFAQEGNPRLTRVLYTRHTTSDVTLLADKPLHQDFGNTTFIHTAGSSSQKGTARIFDCWLARPDLPRVNVYMNDDLYDRLFRKCYHDHLANAANIQLHFGRLSPADFGAVIGNAAFFLCPSRMEGYGHYINQARAAGGLVLTPDVPPMNELVTPASGVLISSGREKWPRHFLGGKSKHALGLRDVPGFVSHFGGAELCAAVDSVLRDLDAHERAARGRRARQEYLYDTAFFAHAMEKLRTSLRPHEKETPQ